MTDHKPCLPECRHEAGGGRIFVTHAPACKNAKPADRYPYLREEMDSIKSKPAEPVELAEEIACIKMREKPAEPPKPAHEAAKKRPVSTEWNESLFPAAPTCTSRRKSSGCWRPQNYCLRRPAKVRRILLGEIGMTEEPIRPADDAEIAEYKRQALRPARMSAGVDPMSPPLRNPMMELIARIEAQAATIRERDETIRKLEIIKTNYRLSDNGRELESLRAQNAAQAEEIKRITERAVQVHLELEHKHATESAELRARCETLEGLLIEHEDLTRKDVCQKLDAEARSIRARREAQPR